MKFLEALAKIPLPKIIIASLLAIIAGFALEQMSWVQTVVEHLLNMEGVPK